MKKITIAFALLIIVSLLICSKFYYKIREFMNPNYLHVSTDKNLDLSKVKIMWMSELLAPSIIFENGNQLDIKFKEYGKNKFHVYYDDKLLHTFSHFKANNWHGNEYYIMIYFHDKIIRVNTRIIGPDSN